jgi:hypothetical protein
MPGVVELQLDPTRVLAQQSIVVTVELKNTGRTPLRNVNPNNKAGGPTLTLTEVASGKSTKASTPHKPGTAQFETGVKPGKSFKLTFPLNNFLKLPGPGTYELQAHYVWDDGQAVSPSARFEVVPAVPESAHIVSAFGGAAPTYSVLWVNLADAGKKKRELWLSSVATSRKPTVDRSVFLMDFAAPGCPIQSIPANEAPAAQWMVWTAEGKLHYGAHKSGMVSDAASVALDHPAAKLFAPALLNPAEKGRALPGVDVLLGEPKTDSLDCHLRVLRLSLSQPARMMVLKPLPPLGMPPWLDTAALPGGMRYTFFAQSVKGQTTLHQYSWSYARPDGITQQLAAWPGDCMAGAQWLTQEKRLVGVLLLRAGELQRYDYRFQHWALSDKGTFEAEKSVPFVAADRTRIIRAVVSINVMGQAHALIATDPTERAWSYVSAEGKLQDLPAEAQPFALPAQVLYRRMEDPTILFSRPPIGFEFARPGE